MASLVEHSYFGLHFEALLRGWDVVGFLMDVVEMISPQCAEAGPYGFDKSGHEDSSVKGFRPVLALVVFLL